MSKESDRFYHSKAWKNKRQYILKRDGYLCLECKKYGRNREAKIVHHIKEYDICPDLKFENNNLVSLCLGCHNKMHTDKGGHYIRY